MKIFVPYKQGNYSNSLFMEPLHSDYLALILIGCITKFSYAVWEKRKDQKWGQCLWLGIHLNEKIQFEVVKLMNRWSFYYGDMKIYLPAMI